MDQTKRAAAWENLEDDLDIDRRRDPKLATLLRQVVKGVMADHAERVAIERTRGTTAQAARELTQLNAVAARGKALLDKMAPETAMRIGNDVETAREVELLRQVLGAVRTKIAQARDVAMKKERRGRPRDKAVRETILELTQWFAIFVEPDDDPDTAEDYAEARWQFVKNSFDACGQPFPTKMKLFVKALPRPRSLELWWSRADQVSRWQDRELKA